jgi:hypothetical protein
VQEPGRPFLTQAQPRSQPVSSVPIGCWYSSCPQSGGQRAGQAAVETRHVGAPGHGDPLPVPWLGHCTSPSAHTIGQWLGQSPTMVGMQRLPMSQPSGDGGSQQAIWSGGQLAGQAEVQLVPGRWAGRQVPGIGQPSGPLVPGQVRSVSLHMSGQESGQLAGSPAAGQAALGRGLSRQMPGLGQPWASTPPSHSWCVKGSQVTGQKAGQAAVAGVASMQYQPKWQPLSEPRLHCSWSPEQAAGQGVEHSAWMLCPWAYVGWLCRGLVVMAGTQTLPRSQPASEVPRGHEVSLGPQWTGHLGRRSAVGSQQPGGTNSVRGNAGVGPGAAGGVHRPGAVHLPTCCCCSLASPGPRGR